MMRDLDVRMGVGEFLLSRVPHSGHANCQIPELPIEEAPAVFQEPPIKIEREPIPITVDTLSADFALPLHDADPLLVPLQFAAVSPGSTDLPHYVETSRGLSPFAAIVMILFACIAALLGGLLLALTTAAPGLSETLSNADDWTADPLPGSLPAKRVTDAILATTPFEAIESVFIGVFLDEKAATSGVDVFGSDDDFPISTKLDALDIEGEGFGETAMEDGEG